MAAYLYHPPSLMPADQVVLLSPASPPTDPALISTGFRRLQQLGVRVTLGQHAKKHAGYLAGSDKQRRQDLTAAFSDPEIKGIFCTRGGYGVSRLLEHLDVSQFSKHPKVFVGYSDLTLLHLALQKAGLISFWGPMPASSTGLTPFSINWLKRAIMCKKPIGLLPTGSETLRPGKVEGRLTGGTLSLLAASIGTPYEVQTQNRIVFLEDIAEEPYRIDRMLTQLLAAGKLSDAAGIVLGIFRRCEAKSSSSGQTFHLREVFIDRLRPLKIPVFSGLPVGHIRNQITLPYGVKARLNAGKCQLEILECGVK